MPKRVLALLALLLAGYEGWTLSNAAEGDTISEVVWALTERFPVISFLFGVVAGHFFWQRRHAGDVPVRTPARGADRGGDDAAVGG